MRIRNYHENQRPNSSLFGLGIKMSDEPQNKKRKVKEIYMGELLTIQIRVLSVLFQLVYVEKSINNLYYNKSIITIIEAFLPVTDEKTPQ